MKEIVRHIKTRKDLLFTFFFAVSSAKSAFAGDGVSDEISWGFLIIGLFGGLALFLYGMEKMSEGMKKSAGKKMRSILAAITKNRVIALLIGAFVTMVIQSRAAVHLQAW